MVKGWEVYENLAIGIVNPGSCIKDEWLHAIDIDYENMIMYLLNEDHRLMEQFKININAESILSLIIG